MADVVVPGLAGFAVGERVFGSAMSRAVADHLASDPATDQLLHLPDGVDDVVAGTLAVAGCIAAAALAAVGLTGGDTVLIGGAAGGVGSWPPSSPGSPAPMSAAPRRSPPLTSCGASASSPSATATASSAASGPPPALTVSHCAADLFGTETAYAAQELGVPAERVSTSAAHDPDLTAKATGGADAAPDTLERNAGLVAAGRLTVPIATPYRSSR